MISYDEKKIYQIERKHHDLHAAGWNVAKLNAYLSRPLWLTKINGFIESFLGEVKDKKILDLGCGIGRDSISLALKGAHVIGVDISAKSIKVAKMFADYMGLSEKIDFKICNAENMGFSDEYFDIIFGRAILHHLPRVEKTLRECHRVLRNDGKIVFIEPLKFNPLVSLYRSLTPKRRTPTEHPFNPDEFISLFRNLFLIMPRYFYLTAPLAIYITRYEGVYSTNRKYQSIFAAWLGFLNVLDSFLLKTFLKKFSWLLLICGFKSAGETRQTLL
jgi:ubiquinone/menaquinone biosynthesis C-methylase UbiE